jgi:hypothetical protein
VFIAVIAMPTKLIEFNKQLDELAFDAPVGRNSCEITNPNHGGGRLVQSSDSCRLQFCSVERCSMLGRRKKISLSDIFVFECSGRDEREMESNGERERGREGETICFLIEGRKCVARRSRGREREREEISSLICLVRRATDQFSMSN